MTRFRENKGYALERKTILCNAGHSGTTGTNAFIDNGTCFVDQSQSATTIVYPVSGMHDGDVINGFRVVGAIGAKSGGVTSVDADLRKVTGGAGAVTDASIDTITQVSVEADTALDSANATSTLSEIVVTDYQYYVLVTVTTAANAENDAWITGVEVDLNTDRPMTV